MDRPTQFEAEKLVNSLNNLTLYEVSGDDGTRKITLKAFPDNETPRHIDSILQLNKYNWYFYLLIDSWTNNNDLFKEAYENLRRMVADYMHRLYSPLEPSVPSDGMDKQSRPLSEWDDHFHYVLIGKGILGEKDHVRGELEKYLIGGWKKQPEPITRKQNLVNALLNRYSGFPTRVGQRRKNFWEKYKLDHISLNTEGTDYADPETDDDQKGSPDARAFETTEFKRWTPNKPGREDRNEADKPIRAWDDHESDIPIYFDETFPDPKWGHPGIMGTEAKTTECIFVQPIAVIQWTNKNLNQIGEEAGLKSARAWSIVAALICEIDGVPLPHVVSVLAEHIAEAEGIEKDTARKRLKKLFQSPTLKKYLKREIEEADRIIGQESNLRSGAVRRVSQKNPDDNYEG